MERMSKGFGEARQRGEKTHKGFHKKKISLSVKIIKFTFVELHNFIDIYMLK